ncbi:MAG TPA: MarR family winged helix-turn-helix transcriptional regulator [Candidatus Acidoferrum sp.]|nr:MarR family winged helix-turn-helix transcriptional regulator [Candidatus Acidoferrum sp.]
MREAVRHLAWFRYSFRKFMRFSEQAARECGLTPQQHQLLLGVAGCTDRGQATVSELAEFLQEHHNSTVQLVNRAAERGLVRKEHAANDRRFVFVSLTHRGTAMLLTLSRLHQQEVRRLQEGLHKPDKDWRPQTRNCPVPGNAKRGARARES